MAVRAQEPDYEEADDEELPLGEGEGEDGADGEGEGSEDAAEHTGEEQETGRQDDVEPAPRQTRGESRFQRLANENAELKRRLDGIERRPAPVQQPQEESEEQFAARISLLPPDERMEARYARSERRNEARLNAMHVQNTVTADKLSYDAKAAADSKFKRYAPEVEAKHAELMAAGQFVPRETVLKFLIGERVLANMGTKEVKGQRQAAQRRVRAQETRPASGRSDAGRPQERRAGNEADGRKKRLDGLQI
jgi:hypothetical protein